VQDGNLIIEGDVAVSTPAELRLQHAEMREPRFARAFALGADFNRHPSKIDANLADEVLKLSIPKRDEARPRRIEVNVN
jgi:HSP20 family protein